MSDIFTDQVVTDSSELKQIAEEEISKLGAIEVSREKLSRFLTVVEAVAGLSKDRSTKVGAIALGPDWEVRALGYNGFPRGVDDNAEEKHKRPEKYVWTEHAERNLIYNAARIGVPLNGCTLIVTPLFPCMDCARAIVQAGFTCVVGHQPDKDVPIWGEQAIKALQLFNEVGLEVIWL